MPEDERIPKLSGSGITIDGQKTLEEYIDEEEEKERNREVEEHRNEETGVIRRRTIYRGGVKVRHEDHKERNARTKHLTARQIRKEYGLMAKPFETQAENAIWAVIEKGPINVAGIHKEIEWSSAPNSLSALMKTVWDRLGEDIFDRYKAPGESGFTYQVRDKVDISVESAIQKYKARASRAYQKKRAEKKAEKKVTVPTDGFDIREVVEERLSNQLGMEVKVSGRVEVVFRFIVGRE